VFLIVRSGDDAVCADRAIGSYPVKTSVVDVGTRRPLGLGGGSLAMLTAAGRAVAALRVTAIALRMTPAREKIGQDIAARSKRAEQAAGPADGARGPGGLRGATAVSTNAVSDTPWESDTCLSLSGTPVFLRH